MEKITYYFFGISEVDMETKLFVGLFLGTAALSIIIGASSFIL